MDFLADSYQFVTEEAEVRYRPMDLTRPMGAFTSGILDFLVTETFLYQDHLRSLGIALFPIMAQPLVTVYNLGPSYTAATQSLVLDGTTLSDIWLGKVVWWNDSAIQALNPNLTLPEHPILLACGNDTVAGVTHTFAKALALFNADFASAWNISTGLNYWHTFAGIAERASWIISYSTTAMAISGAVSYALMKNKAGAIVSPTYAAVMSAMHEAEGQVSIHHLSVDLNNGNLSTSWPMCMTSFVATRMSVNTSDCSYVDTLLQFIAWSQLNHHAVDRVIQWGFTPLSFGFKTRLIDNLGLFQCNAERAFSQVVLLGSGAQSGALTAWANNYPGAEFSMSNFPASTSATVSDMSQSTFHPTFGALDEE